MIGFQRFSTKFEKVPRLFNGAVATYPYTILVTRVDCAIKLLGQIISTTPRMGAKKGRPEGVQWATCIAGESKKIDQSILVIRFEMPYNIWCGGCNSMISKGVRFNTEKKQVGNYYSTNIVIQTDAKNCEYMVISGAQKKYEEFDNEDTETMALPVEEETKVRLISKLLSLQHLPFSPATITGNPGRLVAGDGFLGRHVAREKSNGKARMGYLPERLSRATTPGPH
nr:hypothetical protein [Tanacetum cinerariifolium]